MELEKWISLSAAKLAKSFHYLLLLLLLSVEVAIDNDYIFWPTADFDHSSAPPMTKDTKNYVNICTCRKRFLSFVVPWSLPLIVPCGHHHITKFDH